MSKNHVRDDMHTIAKHISQTILESFGDSIDEWYSYPEIGMYDWEQIVELVHMLGASLSVDPADFKAAYDRLAGRATNEWD
jgi:hypothetical protein